MSKSLIDSDWSKYQHEKMQHFNTVNIAIHTLIITAIGYIIINNKSSWFLLALTIIGIILGIIWSLGLCRCRLDVDVFYGLLRDLEKEKSFGKKGRYREFLLRVTIFITVMRSLPRN